MNRRGRHRRKSISEKYGKYMNVACMVGSVIVIAMLCWGYVEYTKQQQKIALEVRQMYDRLQGE